MAEKGFLVSLFDLSFTEFVTTRLIKVLFVLAIIGSAIGGITLVATGLLSDSGAAGALSLLLGPLAFFVLLLLARLWLEVIIVLFRIAENTGRLVQYAETGVGATAQSTSTGTPPVPPA